MSLYVRSFAKFQSQVHLWNKYLPSARPYYAVKCNPDPEVLDWVSKAGGSFDCASWSEMVLVQELVGKQCASERILFANPCKTQQSIFYAKTLGVSCVTADSMEELIKMDDVGYKPNILLRIAVEDKGSACPFGAKFGLLADEIASVAAVAKQLTMPILGLSFHVGSGSNDPNAFQQAVQRSKHIWNQLQASALVHNMEVLDIGGGWSPDEHTFKQQANSAKLGLLDLENPVQVIAEPGRFFAAPIQTLYVPVIGKKPRNGGGWRYTIDESIYGQFSCIPYDHAKPAIARLILRDSAFSRYKTPATLFGRTCDSLDWIANSPCMEELEVGDWLCIPNMGAYTSCTSTTFNGFPKPHKITSSIIYPSESQLSWLQGLTYPLASMLHVPT